MITTNITWPFPYDPRPNQVEALEWLQAQKAKYLILEAPVGSGKSNIGLAYSQFLSSTNSGDSFILTPQRILQEQYETSFKDIRDLSLVSFYGKSNYQCKTKRASCEIGGLVKPRCHNCAHTNAKQKAAAAANVVMNYKLAMLAFGYTDTFKRHRSLMILDECHTLEHHLVDFDTVTLSYARCQKHDIKWQPQTSIESAIDWITAEYLPKIKQVRFTFKEDIDDLLDKSGADITNSELRKLKDYNNLCDHVDEVEEISLNDLSYLTEHFVLVHDKVMMSFKRLKGAYSFHKILNPLADKFLFMSSTVLNKDGFCRDLGIDPADAAFISLNSEFPVENRPVVYMPQMKMNAGWKGPDKAKERKQMLDIVTQLINAHDEESGIIHTANFQIAEWLVEHISHRIDHKIYHHNPQSGDDRNSVINGFMSDPTPSILISPSSTEGLDLKEDLARFAIFVKVPFGYLGDQWIKKRLDLSSEWYQRRALIDVIQGGGRVVRSSTDKGNVYILDGSWAYLYNQTHQMIPQWWKDSYSVIG